MSKEQSNRCRQCGQRYLINKYYAQCSHQGLCQQHLVNYLNQCIDRGDIKFTCFQDNCDAELRLGNQGYLSVFPLSLQQRVNRILSTQISQNPSPNKVKEQTKCKYQGCSGSLDKNKCRKCSGIHCKECFEKDHPFGQCPGQQRKKPSGCCTIF